MRLLRPSLVVLVLFVPTTVQAHDHVADFFGGVTYANGSNLGGLHVTFAKTIRNPGDRNLAIVGDWTIHRGSHNGDDLTRMTFAVGPRWTFDTHNGHVPSVHVLIGGVRDDAAQNDTSVGVALGFSYEYLPAATRQSGAGVVYRVQTDFVASGVDKFPRLSAGIAYRWK